MSARSNELILGGQKSGKSRRAEMLANAWLVHSPKHKAILIATAQPWDDEMQARIERHQKDRADRVPEMTTLEEPLALAQAIDRHSHATTLVVIDCLTLWLGNLLMPALANVDGEKNRSDKAQAYISSLIASIKNSAGPLVFVGNEIGLGVIPMGRETRAFVDALGLLNQSVADACERVTLMVAGLPLTLKPAA
jgi:adenosylcobinamide kinase/adenosylcobinamide-phosphate guanylyltransferase